MRKPGPSVVLSRWVGSEKLRTNRGLVIGDSVTRAGQIDDDVATSHIKINICEPPHKRILAQSLSVLRCSKGTAFSNC